LFVDVCALVFFSCCGGVAGGGVARAGVAGAGVEAGGGGGVSGGEAEDSKVRGDDGGEDSRRVLLVETGIL